MLLTRNFILKCGSCKKYSRVFTTSGHSPGLWTQQAQKMRFHGTCGNFPRSNDAETKTVSGAGFPLVRAREIFSKISRIERAICS